MRKVLRITLLGMVVLVAVTVLNIVVPAPGRITDPALPSNAVSFDRPITDIQIVYVGIDPVNFKVHLWVKNVGEAEILAIDSSDIFYKTSKTIDRLPYNASPCNGCWSYSIEGDTLWKPRVTVKVTLNLTTLASGDYLVRFVTPSGATAEQDFTV